MRFRTGMGFRDRISSLRDRKLLLAFLGFAILTGIIIFYRANLFQNLSLPPIPQDLQFPILIADILIAIGIFLEVLQNFLFVDATRRPHMSVMLSPR